MVIANLWKECLIMTNIDFQRGSRPLLMKRMLCAQKLSAFSCSSLRSWSLGWFLMLDLWFSPLWFLAVQLSKFQLKLFGVCCCCMNTSNVGLVFFLKNCIIIFLIFWLALVVLLVFLSLVTLILVLNQTEYYPSLHWCPLVSFEIQCELPFKLLSQGVCHSYCCLVCVLGR